MHNLLNLDKGRLENLSKMGQYYFFRQSQESRNTKGLHHFFVLNVGYLFYEIVE
jgi:hypothetical protein